ncbi:hypothetical protein Tco_1312266 [Tanacetum coccineum]
MHYRKTRISRYSRCPSTAHGMLKSPLTANCHHPINTAAPPKENATTQSHVSCEKSITMIGYPTQLWSKRAMVVGGCAWTSLTLTKHVHKDCYSLPEDIDWKVESLCDTLQVLLGRIQGLSLNLIQRAIAKLEPCARWSITSLIDLRTAVKGQILADFLIEKPETDAVLPQSEVKLQNPWILFTDRSSCVDGSSAGPILTNPEGHGIHPTALRFEFTAYEQRGGISNP